MLNPVKLSVFRHPVSRQNVECIARKPEAFHSNDILIVALKKKYVSPKEFHPDKISIAGRNLDKGYIGGSAQGCLLPKDGREWMSGTSS